MAIRLKHKLDLFEAFQERKLETKVETKVDVKPETADNPIASIKADVDNIISGLNDLVNNLGDSTPSEPVSEDVINENNPVDQVLASDISAIPMLVAGGALLGVVALVAYIKKVKKKKKIKGLYEPAHKSKLTAAKMDVKLSQIDLSGVEDPKKKEKLKQQVEAFKEKQQKLLDDAAEVEKTLEEAFPDNGELLALLRAESRVQVAEIKLSGNLSDAEKAKMEDMLANAKKSIEKQVAAAEKKVADAEELEKNTPNADKIENLEKMKKEAEEKKSKLDPEKEEDKSEIDSLDGQIKGYQDQIAKLKGEEPTPDKGKEPAKSEGEPEGEPKEPEGEPKEPEGEPKEPETTTTTTTTSEPAEPAEEEPKEPETTTTTEPAEPTEDEPKEPEATTEPAEPKEDDSEPVEGEPKEGEEDEEEEDKPKESNDTLKYIDDFSISEKFRRLI
jgi:hypothetical protein